MGGPELARGHLEQGDLSAVAVEEHQSLEPGCSQLAPDRFDAAQEVFRRQAQAAGKAEVLRREAQALNRETPDRGLRRQGCEHLIEDLLGKERIGPKGQVRPVLLNGTKGPDHGAARGLGGGLNRGPVQVVEATRPLPGVCVFAH